MVVMKILVVDDEQAVRESLRRSLTFNGYDVVLAEDGASALDQIGKEQPDLVILDVMMPRMDFCLGGATRTCSFSVPSRGGGSHRQRLYLGLGV